MVADDDLILLDQWRAGDSAAGNALFSRHFPSIYRFFEHKTEGDIDDLVQETFLQCLSSRDTFKQQSSFRTYLFAIARHVLFHHWRKRATNRPTIDFEDVSIASLSTSIATRMSKNQDRARLLAALRSLPVEQQLLLELFYWEGFDRDQLAEVFNVESATIGSRLFRARQTLQHNLETETPLSLDSGFDTWARGLAKD
ncbi:MAG TPA: sigma-70 family RNA polymerase sigma factor [Kofleriaceae bacterium]|nr:sigma-70 family RNA polymerase sigma factor [Kofleriaceae bacterium]